jgi:hypothetical protein
MPYGKGRVVYLGSGELWRLRQYDETFYERLWMNLVRHAASGQPREKGRRGERREPAGGERRAVEKGLAWLARQQHRDGHWEWANESLPVTTTALAGQALLLEGSTIRGGRYAGNLRRAAEWLMARARPDGRVGDPGAKGESVPGLSSHAFAVTFLASVYGEEEDLERRKKLEKVLQGAVKYLVDAQTARGGWGLVPAKEGNDFDEAEATAHALLALRAARQVGLPVPREAIATGDAYLERTVKPLSLDVVEALVALGPEAFRSPSAKKWLRDVEGLLAFHGGGLIEYHNVYTARLAYALGEEGYAKLFPESKPGDRITWSGYRKTTFAHLLGTQRDDGSWTQGLDAVYSTAVNLMILQLERSAVPEGVTGWR